ncbi:MAG: rod shape-determining protein [Clostridia bacterium]|nr:rod shape-determining protein [Clostridia bacterium]
MKINLGIDIGGSFVSIYKKGEGIVFKEPNLISVKGSNSNYSIIAMGTEAKKMQGKTAEDILTFSPVSEGTIKSVDYATLYLKYALSKLFNSLSFKNIEAMVAVPCGLDSNEIQKYEQVCIKAGIKKIHHILGTICSAIGAGKQVDTTNSYMLVDIGGSKTDIAVMNLLSIVKGATLGIGGKAIDNSIISTIKEKYDLLIGEATAENLKKNVGSLYKNDTLNMEVIGIDIQSKSPRGCVVFSKDIKDCLTTYFNEIVKVAKATIQECPPEISSDIINNQITITGGMSNLTGVEKFLSKELGISCEVSENSDNNTVLGLAKLLGN